MVRIEICTEKLNQIEPVSTQIIPKDGTQFFNTRIIASSLERFAVEINIFKGQVLKLRIFEKKQKFMQCHIKNPILSENLV